MASDEALYQRVREGDMAAFEALYQRYEAQLFGFLVRTLRTRADAEDVFHDAFLNALKSPEVRFEQGSFRSWLFRIARNLCHNRRRSAERGARAVDALPEPAETQTAEGALVRRELFEALDDAVARLPPGAAWSAASVRCPTVAFGGVDQASALSSVSIEGAK